MKSGAVRQHEYNTTVVVPDELLYDIDGNDGNNGNDGNDDNDDNDYPDDNDYSRLEPLGFEGGELDMFFYENGNVSFDGLISRYLEIARNAPYHLNWNEEDAGNSVWSTTKRNLVYDTFDSFEPSNTGHGIKRNKKRASRTKRKQKQKQGTRKKQKNKKTKKQKNKKTKKQKQKQKQKQNRGTRNKRK